MDLHDMSEIKMGPEDGGTRIEVLMTDGTIFVLISTADGRFAGSVTRSSGDSRELPGKLVEPLFKLAEDFISAPPDDADIVLHTVHGTTKITKKGNAS